MENKISLFDTNIPPLAERVRPKSLQEFIGQSHILGENKTVTLDSVTSVTYSAISKFYYEKTALDICENIAPKGGEFAKGLYKINIFDGGRMIATTNLVLD